jgi:phosphinothricin acetyltransferase
MLVRPAELSDAEALADIYNAEVLGSTATFDLVPRTVEEQRSWQVDRSGVHAVIVAVDDTNTVVGFASLSPFRSRPAYSTTVENSIYVHQDHRGRGIAHVLMVELVETARSHGFHSMIARIADAQEASVRLHTSVGFELVGTEREVGRKFNRWLDVAVMQLLL